MPPGWPKDGTVVIVTTGAAWGRRHSESAMRLKTLPMDVLVTGTPWPGASVIVAVTEFVGFAWLVAVRVTVCSVVMLAGAVYRPAALTLPTPAGFNDQVTAVLIAFFTVATNCCVSPLKRVEAIG